MMFEKMEVRYPRLCLADECREKASYQLDQSPNLVFCTAHAIELTNVALPIPQVKIVAAFDDKFHIEWKNKPVWLPIAGVQVATFTLDQMRLIVELLEKLS